MKKRMTARKNGVRESREDKVFLAICYIILSLVLVVCIYPLYFIVLASLSDPDKVLSGQVLLTVKGFMLDGYREIFRTNTVVRGFVNSVFYTTVGTIINLAVTLPAAYALSRKDLVGRRQIMVIFVFTMYFNGGMIPTYLLIRNIGLYNTPLVLLVCSALSVYNMIIARSFFDNTLPEELLEAARIDGCGNTRFFFQIALPLSKAMIAVVALYYAVGHWNSYMNALLYIDSQQYKPLQLVLRELLLSTSAMSQLGSDQASMLQQQKMVNLMQYCIIVVAIVPMLCIYPFVQKYFIKGVMVGAVKG